MTLAALLLLECHRRRFLSNEIHDSAQLGFVFTILVAGKVQLVDQGLIAFPENGHLGHLPAEKVRNDRQPGSPRKIAQNGMKIRHDVVGPKARGLPEVLFPESQHVVVVPGDAVPCLFLQPLPENFGIRLVKPAHVEALPRY